MKKAQTSLEYAMVIAAVVAAMIMMQFYIRRAFQGHYKETADSFGEIYAPEHVTSNITLELSSNYITTTNEFSEEYTDSFGDTYNRIVVTTFVNTLYENSRKYGNETIGPIN